jgi:glutamate synthase (NADPH/NADH) small chain
MKKAEDMEKKITPERVPMPEQDPEERVKNFREVALGYSQEQAVMEARRCLQCSNPRCLQGCPAGVDIPSFIKCIADRDFDAAIDTIKENNYLPAICGRVCPQEDQCEKYCTLGKNHEAVAIGRLERFAADYLHEKGLDVPKKSKPTGKEVAIVGSGPAGLTVAAYLARHGYSVTIFEALHEPGGVLIYGIPEFRLPREIVRAEIDFIRKLGAEIKTDVVIGKTLTIDDLFDMGYSAVFIGTGAGFPRFLNIPGENLNNIYSGNEFLIRVNLMKSRKFPEYDTPVKVGERTAVIGGGNVAIDCARCAVRLGAQVTLVYRRTEEEMPARLEEIKHAKEEGIEVNELVAPIKFIGDEEGRVKKMECIRMKLGALDESGRRRPIPVRNSEFAMDVDTVVVAIGQSPNPLITRETPDLKTTEKGTIVVDEEGRTSRKGVFAGGDITTGTATVIQAIGAGKKAAEAIHQYLRR